MHVTRTVTKLECASLLEDLKTLRFQFQQLASRHDKLVESVWLGGNQKADNTTVPPVQIKEAFTQLRRASKLVNEADSAVALYLATEAQPWPTEVIQG